jgi:NTP pyrophosphatase (non-canonical NTP hydrolase)
MHQYQKELDEWFKDKGWPYWQPLEILARLMEETGEFARIVNHIYGPKKKKFSEEEQDLKGELGDILYTLACFANSHGIDLDEALKGSIDKVTTRDKDRFPGGIAA